MVDMDKMRGKHRASPANEKVLEMLADIDVATGVSDFELSNWEEEFIESITEQIDDGRTLTSPQLESLEGIWNKI